MNKYVKEIQIISNYIKFIPNGIFVFNNTGVILLTEEAFKNFFGF